MNNKPQPYEHSRHFAMALDPIHIGTGGYRLGRVDMAIVREPGTNLPKLPGASLSGACRTYAAMKLADKFPGCASQGGHCCESDCPICIAFGFSGQRGSFQGLAQISDARLVLFPVHSLAGPVWVTCRDCLLDWGIQEAEPPEGKVRVAGGITVNDRLNLGWLLLQKDNTSTLSLDGKLKDVPTQILDRAVLVSNRLFGHIVNDNLEVRTSVSIDPSTGAAADQALFNYEALPRTTVVAFEITISTPTYYRVANQPLNITTAQVKKTVEDGLRLLEWMGVGGMNTRGMGRLRVLGLNQSDAGAKI